MPLPWTSSRSPPDPRTGFCPAPSCGQCTLISSTKVLSPQLAGQRSEPRTPGQGIRRRGHPFRALGAFSGGAQRCTGCPASTGRSRTRRALKNAPGAHYFGRPRLSWAPGVAIWPRHARPPALGVVSTLRVCSPAWAPVRALGVFSGVCRALHRVPGEHRALKNAPGAHYFGRPKLSWAPGRRHAGLDRLDTGLDRLDHRVSTGSTTGARRARPSALDGLDHRSGRPLGRPGAPLGDAQRHKGRPARLVRISTGSTTGATRERPQPGGATEPCH
jgi:hypothetical protein